MHGELKGNIMSAEYRLEIDLMRKNRPKWKSKRFKRLQEALYAKQMDNYRKGIMPTFNQCEICGTHLINPQSILIHQGGFCQNKISKITSPIKI